MNVKWDRLAYQLNVATLNKVFGIYHTINSTASLKISVATQNFAIRCKIKTGFKILRGDFATRYNLYRKGYFFDNINIKAKTITSYSRTATITIQCKSAIHVS